MWDNLGMEERARANYINWGIGLAMVVVAALIGHYNGGFWWWIDIATIVALALVLHGHFPDDVTKLRIGVGMTVLLVAALLVGTGWFLGRKSPEIAKKEPAPSVPATSTNPAPSAQPENPKPTKKEQPHMDRSNSTPARNEPPSIPKPANSPQQIIQNAPQGINIAAGATVTNPQVINNLTPKATITWHPTDYTAAGDEFVAHWSILVTGSPIPKLQATVHAESLIRATVSPTVVLGLGLSDLKDGSMSSFLNNVFGELAMTAYLKKAGDNINVAFDCGGVECELVEQKNQRARLATQAPPDQNAKAVPSPPSLIQNNSQGINIGPGASAPNATVVNNGPPPAKVTWRTQANTGAKNVVDVVLTVDRSPAIPAFIAECDSPCHGVGAWVMSPTAGYLVDVESRGYRVGGQPNTTVVLMTSPKPVGLGSEVKWSIESEASKDSPVKIKRVDLLPEDRAKTLPVGPPQ
jgi:hypothetical protein